LDIRFESLVGAEAGDHDNDMRTISPLLASSFVSPAAHNVSDFHTSDLSSQKKTEIASTSIPVDAEVSTVNIRNVDNSSYYGEVEIEGKDQKLSPIPQISEQESKTSIETPECKPDLKLSSNQTEALPVAPGTSSQLSPLASSLSPPLPQSQTSKADASIPETDGSKSSEKDERNGKSRFLRREESFSNEDSEFFSDNDRRILKTREGRRVDPRKIHVRIRERDKRRALESESESSDQSASPRSGAQLLNWAERSRSKHRQPTRIASTASVRHAAGQRRKNTFKEANLYVCKPRQGRQIASRNEQRRALHPSGRNGSRLKCEMASDSNGQYDWDFERHLDTEEKLDFAERRHFRDRLSERDEIRHQDASLTQYSDEILAKAMLPNNPSFRSEYLPR
jgi:hypothetical protein